MNIRKMFLLYEGFPCELNALCNKHAVKVFEKFVDPKEGFSYIKTEIVDGEVNFHYEQRFFGKRFHCIDLDMLVRFIDDLERTK